MRDWVVGGAVIERRSMVGEIGVGESGVGGSGVGGSGVGGSGVGESGPDGPAPVDGVLLVENLRKNGTSDWTPPGGVIDPGEVLLDGLTREVREETGLQVVEWGGPLYQISAVAPDLGWRLRVEVHLAVAVEGALHIGEDPDGIVVAADWVESAICAERLGRSHPWVREPLLEWIVERFEPAREFHYEVLGTPATDFRVTRL